MKTIVGIDFTDGIVNRLRERGFDVEDAAKDVHGFKPHFISLEDSSGLYHGFELHIVGDEVEYCFYHKLQHVFPFIKDLDIERKPSRRRHTNTVFELVEVITNLSMLDSKLASFLQIRKGFPMAALILRCHDLKIFREIARPDETFSYKGQEALLMHLGPSCFDLVVIA